MKERMHMTCLTLRSKFAGEKMTTNDNEFAYRLIKYGYGHNAHNESVSFIHLFFTFHNPVLQAPHIMMPTVIASWLAALYC